MKNSISTVEGLLKDENRKLKKVKLAGKKPFPDGYRPELEQIDELILELASRYLQVIGISLWTMKIRRINIFIEVAIMSYYLASQQLGHIESFYHAFEYFRKHYLSRAVFDPFQPKVDNNVFVSGAIDWKYFYGYIKEEIPPMIPAPLGNNSYMTCFADDNHTGNVVARSSRTGALICVMNAPIIFFLKKHNTVEIGTFGSEFLAM